MSAANIFFILLLFEEGLRVCNDAVLLDFSVVLREFLFQVAVLRFSKTKQFVEFSGNFKKVFSCLCYFVRCLNIFLWFCSIHTPLTLYTSLLLSGILSTAHLIN